MQVERVSRTEAVKLDVPSSISSFASSLQERLQPAGRNPQVQSVHLVLGDPFL